ncbi:bacteriocin [Breoghania sp. L-A4]|nr:bacteriocin [Breoghania sp. L-A4]
MKNIVIVLAAALALASCQTARQDRALTGGAIGAGTGAVIGAVAGKSVGGAVAGGVIGAAAGAIIADATRPGRCYYRDRRGRKHYVRCR